MSHYRIAPVYRDFVEKKLLVGLPISSDNYWRTLETLLDTYTPINQALLARRAQLQEQIDQWHENHTDFCAEFDSGRYQAFLRDIGYLVPEGSDFTISTENVDSEISEIASPQLVVPITNARYALNAVNSRYRSLYDSLYGSDAIIEIDTNAKGVDQNRVQKVQQWCRNWLDEIAPLNQGLHADATGYSVKDGALHIHMADSSSLLTNKALFIGFEGHANAPSAIILRHHGLHIIIHIDPKHPIGQTDTAGISDIEVEANLTSIMDMEDSIAAVDTEDKVHAYSNWLGLMQQNLTTQFKKGNQIIQRGIHPDRTFNSADGQPLTLRAHALLWIRNVGHLMTTPMIHDQEGNEMPEGLLDAIFSVAAGMHDLLGNKSNSPAGSIYVVKPKMHGPEEVAFTNDVFGFIEKSFGLEPHCVKIGIMDEERRTSANLRECIRAAQHRLAFINTGFLDRTGDEIHTAMRAGAFPPKDTIKLEKWIEAYENRNVTIGLACGLKGKAQIGKGMWAIPDQMGKMLSVKIAHPKSGANCAWVPSPTAAAIHALHYHAVNVSTVQEALIESPNQSTLNDLLSVPLLKGRNLTSEEILAEAENNAQGILGYVVRWIDQGIGCSKVLDIHHVGLMEDRATCRISSQLLANWLWHGLISSQEMMQIMRRMALVVDRQNKEDTLYTPMAPGYDGKAFNAACDLVFKGAQSPSGYTEPLLHEYRQKAKYQKTK